ncbi:MAG: DUF4430 domain-containing protein [Parcubacteria group bacterium]|nr:DUF4430 domain-containing protein [Parcubacteria group bacterium]
MKKFKFLSLALVFSLAITVLVGCTGQTEEQNDEQTEEQAQEETEKEEQKVSIVINYGDEEKSYKVDFEEGMTAYDALKTATEGDSIEIKTTEYDFGMSVDSIGEKVGGVDSKYWMYYVDGTASPVAADKQELTEGMKVEFKYEASSL